MRPAEHKARVLAIDLRPRQFGYAVFEGPKHLIDWGGRTFDSCPKAGERVADLAALFHPMIVAVRRDRNFGVRNPGRIAAILKSIRQTAARHSIPVHLVRASDIQEAFRTFKIRNKDDMAFVLATVFPELLWKLPPKRKRWQHEHSRMIMFDAIATGFAYYWHNGTRDPPAN